MQNTVLVIDDDDILRNSLAKGLVAQGFTILTAENASVADAVLSRVVVDAIVLDRMMPGIDGLTALGRWRAAGDATPVIMLTAMTGPQNAIDGLEVGADDYLAKPFQLKELILRLNNIIARRKENSPKLPDGLAFVDQEFFVNGSLLALSGAEKCLLRALTAPVGNIVPAAPMVAKRLRQKLNMVLGGADILTIRSRGYKLVVKTV